MEWLFWYTVSAIVPVLGAQDNTVVTEVTILVILGVVKKSKRYRDSFLMRVASAQTITCPSTGNVYYAQNESDDNLASPKREINRLGSKEV